MNCMEAQALVEDALDNSLTGSRKRALDLHLSRCDTCRTFFAAERNEHRRWFQAMNDPESLRRLPNGFADQFAAEMVKRHAAPQRKWALVRAFRRVAAVLAAMLLFAGLAYAAVTGLRQMELANQNEAEGETVVTDVTSGTTVASDVLDSVGRAAPSAPQSGIAISPIAPNQDSQSTPQGEQKMTGRKAAAAALSAALAAAPLSAADGNEYQFIDPATYPAANPSYPAASDAITLETGTMRIAGTAGELEARSRSTGASVAIALNATQFKTFIMTIR